MKGLDEGDRVVALGYDDVARQGVITDVLTVMYFITFDDGTEAFVFKADRNLSEIKC